MEEKCSHNCDECKENNCEERKVSFLEELHSGSSVKKVIGVVSGKGGVGKSLVTSLMANSFNQNGYKTAIMDADITGPSIPKMFGINKKRAATMDDAIIPIKTETGISVISLNLLTENETDPVIWRGPIIAGAVRQFWTDVFWDDIDYMFIDMPPGTGDVPLTVFQSIPVDGIIIVTSPQELVSMIVEKSVKMANSMNIPVLGIVENMSYVTCPNCNEQIKIFGESHIESIAEKYKIDLVAKLPVDPKIAEACDKGKVESIKTDYFKEFFNKISKI